MPAIPTDALDCVVYLYPDVDSANNGERAGACGFLVGITSKNPEFSFAYVVTNSHVIREGKSPVLRVNTRDGAFQIIDKTDEHWIHHPDGDDIAVLSINLGYETAKVRAIHERFFATRETIDQFQIGPGDDVFIPGRFVNHEGKQRNIPAVRFGNIAMLAHESIRTERGLLQEALLVECRSIPGYSGSPVFLIPNPFSGIPRPTPPSMLLGIVMGNITYERQVLDKTTRRPANPNWIVQSNTGMTTVIPAWKIRELLFMDELVKIREEIDRSHQ